MIELPGQNIEKMAADVGTEAGKSIVKGFGRLGGAFFAEWIAQKEAKAAATKLAIETEAQINKEKQLQAHHRESEIEALEHNAMMRRRFERMRVELGWEQANIESIGRKAIEYCRERGDAFGGRDIEEDFMFRFADFAQRVSDKGVQQLWARILAGAATEGAPLLSPAALQTMSLLDKKAAADFQKFCSVVQCFGYYPGHERLYDESHEIQNIDLIGLKELGLLVDQIGRNGYSFPGFELSMISRKQIFSHINFHLTKRGGEIANSVFNPIILELPKNVIHEYIKSTIAAQAETQHGVAILPLPEDQSGIAPFRLHVTYPRGTVPIEPDFTVLGNRISDDLREILTWASTKYDIMIENNIPEGPEQVLSNFPI